MFHDVPGVSVHYAEFPTGGHHWTGVFLAGGCSRDWHLIRDDGTENWEVVWSDIILCILIIDGWMMNKKNYDKYVWLVVV